MAECLFVGRKDRPTSAERRATFVILDRQPKNTLEGEQLAQAISKVVGDGNVRRLEDGPYGGTRILLGNTLQGEVLNCPLPAENAWQMVGIKDITLGQTAHQLTNGRLWIEGMASKDHINIPIASISEVIDRTGPHHLDITGAQVKSDGLPQGPFECISGLPAGSAYPCLWNHTTILERKLIVQPDSHCRIRQVGGRISNPLVERAEARWATASRAHYNLDLRFNSQSIIVAMTQQPSIGGRAWPTVVFDDPTYEYAFALWSNSTLGLLCHWWMSNKSQEGRGTSTITSIPSFATLDTRALSPAQHEAARLAFEALARERFLPFDQINEDVARSRLDRRLIVDVLGLPAALCSPNGPMERLREKLAGEPQIHSDKKTRVVFTADGHETSISL